MVLGLSKSGMCPKLLLISPDQAVCRDPFADSSCRCANDLKRIQKGPTIGLVCTGIVEDNGIHLYKYISHKIYDPEAPHLSTCCVLFFVCMQDCCVDILILWLFVFWLLPLHSHFGVNIYSYNTRSFFLICTHFPP